MAYEKDAKHFESYTTIQALSELHKEFVKLVSCYENKSHVTWRNLIKVLRLAVRNIFPWPAFLSVMVGACLLITAVCFHDEDRGNGSGSQGWLAFESALLLLIAFVNMALSFWNSTRQTRETVRLSKHLLHTIENCCLKNNWTAESYSDVNTPLSPCITLQWTHRDGHLVNLPQPLLVCGDIIKLRPGHQAPGRCEKLEPDDEGRSLQLEAGDVYIPEQEDIDGDSISGPKGRTPLVAQDFRLLETPIVKNIRMMLEDTVIQPASVLENECHRVVYVWVLQRLMPVFLTLMLIISILRYVYLQSFSGLWMEMVLILPVHAILPLLPLTFPALWICVNTYGQARVFAAFQMARTLKAWPLGSASNLGSFSTISIEEARVDLSWFSVWEWFWTVVTSNPRTMCKGFRLLHALGSVTSLCCVDKKGLLSWSNPSAEKVFFYSHSGKESMKLEEFDRNSVSGCGDIPDTLQIQDHSRMDETKRKKLRKFQKNAMPGHIEVFDLTHDPKDAFRVNFDDPGWKHHLDSLKPLGLCILLNTCNGYTSDWYTQFSDHVGCEASKKEETVAVVNRRCLCEVARVMGFRDQALEVFSQERTCGVYRQVPPEEMEKEKLQRAKSFLYHKIPMPNYTSVIVRDKSSGMYQLLSQGTADILLDSCTDYWNGFTLCTLTEIDRKRILDFYHRNSMAAYCTAFSYKPIGHSISRHLENEYIELIGMPNQLLARCSELETLSGEGPGVVSKSFSMDSLMDDTSLVSVDDVVSYYEAQKNQTFIGMATLQYQARQDFIQLIEKLESACIRFVHFSKENELRSRVFSEKMGLEAGWNCHISLLNEDPSLNEAPDSGPGSFTQGQRSAESTSQDHLDQTETERKLSGDALALRSHSAPCMFALDEVQVKFEVPTREEMEDYSSGCDSETEDKELKMLRHVENVIGTVSVPVKNRRPDKEKEDEENNKIERKRLLSCSSSGSAFSSASSSSDEEVDQQSDSRYTSSYVTEYTDDSLTGALDNRAQLPRGINQIRPHLEKVDNVPLLVNLFTDCTPPATQEMIKIMQENGEVVLCIGSSLNMANTPMFLQADCSIAMEPLYPQLCARKAAVAEVWNEQNPSPTELASRLLAFPSSLAFQREDNVSLVQLIAEARHHIFSLRNCFYLLLCCHLCLAMSFVLASAFLLPPPLSPQHLLWLLFLALPLLASGLMGNPVDPRIMAVITHKNKQHVNMQMVSQFLMQFCLRFLPSVIIGLICFGLTLYSYCRNTSQETCFLYQFSKPNITYNTWEEKYSGGLVLAQNIFHLYIFVFCVVTSMSLVHWQDHIWSNIPFSNRLWTVIASTLLVVQILFCVGDVSARSHFTLQVMPVSHVHPGVWVLGFVWPLIIIGLNELVKCLEIKFFLQHQRRARLDFGTKLGMNSPF